MYEKSRHGKLASAQFGVHQHAGCICASTTDVAPHHSDLGCNTFASVIANCPCDAAGTGVVQKLPADWEQQIADMNKRIAVISFEDDVGEAFVYSMDETFVNLVPMGNSYTWHKKGDRTVPVAAFDDKRGYTAAVTSKPTGNKTCSYMHMLTASWSQLHSALMNYTLCQSDST